MLPDLKFVAVDDAPGELMRIDSHYAPIVPSGDTVKIVVPWLDGYCIVAPNPVQAGELRIFIDAIRDGLNHLQGVWK